LQQRADCKRQSGCFSSCILPGQDIKYGDFMLGGVRLQLRREED
jgi:hypothetical protein